MRKEVFFIENHIDDASIRGLIQEIQKMRDSGDDETITLFVSSPGGRNMSAIGFYDWVRTEKIPLTTIATGRVTSAALYVFLSGTKRKAMPHSIFLIHPGGRVGDGIRRWLLRIISPRHYWEDKEFDLTIDRAGQDIYVKETKLPLSIVEGLLTRRHLVMTPAQALEKGFIDEIT